MRVASTLTRSCAVLVAYALVTTTAAGLEPVVTGDRAFNIPFALDPSATADERPVQVQLLVSYDGGRQWQVHATERPEAERFAFVAPGDGEYAFMIRTVDRLGRVVPDGPPSAEMLVVVRAPRPADRAQATFSGELPAGVRPRMVNSRAFEVEYDAATLSGDPTARAVLWWTNNGGYSWQLFGADDDAASPLPVTVDRDGFYGLWMAIDRADQRGVEPRPGDAPQMWVGVDTTRPEARLTMAETSSSPDSALTVRWEATDLRLARRPVSLSYATSPSGPWTTLAGNLDNEGAYRAPSNQPLPERLFLRLEVRDEAGNVQTSHTTEPLVLARRVGAPAASQPTAATALGVRSYHVLR